MHYYYNRQGRPISNEQWEQEFRMQDRRVRYTDLGALGRVSTVWIGLNHAYNDGPPLIFETLVFDGPMEGFMDRYPSEAAAVAGHTFAVQALMFYRVVPSRPLIHNGRKPRVRG